MATEWTQKEQAQAQEQVIADGGFGRTYYATACEFACQRNRMIAAAKYAMECLACEYYAGAYMDLNLAIAACTEGRDEEKRGK